MLLLNGYWSAHTHTNTRAHTLGYCFRKCHRKSESLSLDSHLWRQHIIGRTTLCFMRLAEHDKPSTRVCGGSQQFVSRLRSSAAFCGHQYTLAPVCVCVFTSLPYDSLGFSIKYSELNTKYVGVCCCCCVVFSLKFIVKYLA